MKKYLLFDLDGTLTDPKVGITTCVQYALKAFGIEEPDLDKLESFIGPPLKDSFMQFYGMDEEQANEAVDKYRERFNDIGIFENKVYDGIPAMLRTLQSKGMHLAVASSKPTVYVERILEHFHIAKYFEVVVGSELDGSRVNKDEIILEALNRLFHYKPIQRSQVYMIGDRKFDVEGAKAHQIESVAVLYGYGNMQEFKAAKADYIVRTVDELQKFLLRGADEEKSYGTQSNPSSPNGAKKVPLLRKIWVLIFSYLMFVFVRNIVMNIVYVLFASQTGALGDIMQIKDEAGTVIGLNGNAETVAATIGYLAGALAVFSRAKLFIEKTADDMRLAHLKKEPLQNYVFLVVAGIGSVLGINLLFHLSGMTAQSAAYQAVSESQYAASLWVGLLCYGLITPMAEELLFRGIIYNYLRRFVDLRLAIVISALVFAVYHANAVQGSYALLIGCLMAYGYEYFGSYRIPVLLHIISNVLAYCLSYMPAAVSAILVSWPVCILCLAVAAVCIVMLHRKKNLFA